MNSRYVYFILIGLLKFSAGVVVCALVGWFAVGNNYYPDTSQWFNIFFMIGCGLAWTGFGFFFLVFLLLLGKPKK